MDILDRVILEVKRQGISQKELCERLGLTKQAFTDWKRGFTTSYTKHLPKIAEVLGVSVDYLLGNTDDPTLASERNPGIKKDPADETAGLEELLQNPDLKAAYEKLVKLGPEELEIANAQIDLILKLREKREAKDTHHA